MDRKNSQMKKPMSAPEWIAKFLLGIMLAIFVMIVLWKMPGCAVSL